MRILYATAFFPFPPTSGGRLRVKNMLDGLSQSHEVHLLSLGFEADDRLPERQALAKSSCESVTVIPHQTRRLRAALQLGTGRPYELNLLWNRAYARRFEALALNLNPDIIWCSRITTAQYLPQLLKTFRPRLAILDQHDLASYLWRLIRDNSEKPWERCFAYFNAMAVRRFEKNFYGHLDVSISVSEHERAMTSEIAPSHVELLVAPNGVDTDYFTPPQETQEEPCTISMVGRMNGVRNIDAAMYFADKVFPTVRKNFPQAQFLIVGGDPDRQILNLGQRAGITVTGYVDDVRPYLARSTVVVLPHRMGSGVKHKLPIALAMAKPVVTTSNGSQGIDVTDGEHVLIRDDAESFTDAVCQLLGDPPGRQRMGESAMHLMRECYSWRAISARLSDQLSALAHARSEV